MIAVGEILARHLMSFGDLPPADRAVLAEFKAEVRELPRFTNVLRAGERPVSVVVVLSGLHRYGVGPEGGRQIHSFYLPTEAPSLETLYIDYMDNNLGAVVHSEVGLISHEQLYRLIDERPEIRKLLWRQTLVQAAIFRAWLARNSNMPAHATLAHLFCELFARARAAGLTTDDSCALPLTQELVGDALGLTPVHTNRTLQALRETGVVEWRSGRLTIKNWSKLCEMARSTRNIFIFARSRRSSASGAPSGSRPAAGIPGLGGGDSDR